MTIRFGTDGWRTVAEPGEAGGLGGCPPTYHYVR
jgi:hypothetical protein